ncbi:MAG TPA: ABC transporter substrate-binding protein [Candidatus Tectomicrobia bacterium]|nr:ABC transporter substrate-binding protein [Candidatus Tectomicrobia bacterium]
MRLLHWWRSGLVAVVLGGLVGVIAVAAGEQFVPILGVREGGQRFMMIPRVDGFIAYLTLLNERDGGINGVKLVWEECETVFDVDRTVECYERLKARGRTGAAAVPMHSTPLTYALTERAAHDQIPLVTVGIGRADAADGRVFPYIFNPPSHYRSMNTAKIRFIGQQAGGVAQLKGLKIANVYIDNDYGRETIPILDAQAAHYGFAVQHLPIKEPGLDQKATWLRVKVFQPDWVILRDTIVGAAPTCAEQDVVPAGEAGRGFICVTFLGAGADFPVIQEIRHYVYAQGQGPGPEGDIGTDRWKRGVVDAVFVTEGIRRGMREFGNQPLTGAQVQWGLEHLSFTAAALKELGLEGLISPVSLSCRDHEGGASVKFQQWDGTQWTVLTDWIAPDQALVRPLIEASAAKYAQEKGITPRDCP